MTTSSLSDSLHQLMHSYRTQLRNGIEQQQISLPITQIRALKGVCRLPACTARSIADAMKKDKAQITRVINELAASGLIEKRDNPKDQRSQLLVPTKAGKKMLQKIDAIEAQAAAHMTRNLSEEEISTFRRISDTMINSTAANTPSNKD